MTNVSKSFLTITIPNLSAECGTGTDAAEVFCSTQCCRFVDSLNLNPKDKNNCINKQEWSSMESNSYEN